jgi:hypothetical protein
VKQRTLNRETNKLKMKIDNIEKEVTHDMQNLRNKNETKIQNIMEGHSSRLEQMEDRISEPEDEKEIKGKTEELLVKQFKTCEMNMLRFADQTSESRALKKEKRCKQKRFIIYSTK